MLGGYGYMGEYVVERLWRDAKLLEIGGGTLEAHQKNLTKDLSRRPRARAGLADGRRRAHARGRCPNAWPAGSRRRSASRRATCAVHGLRRLAGGASRETWAFELAAQGGFDGAERKRLVLRRDPPGRGGEGDRSLEFRVVRAAHAGGRARAARALRVHRSGACSAPRST